MNIEALKLEKENNCFEKNTFLCLIPPKIGPLNILPDAAAAEAAAAFCPAAAAAAAAAFCPAAAAAAAAADPPPRLNP